MDQSELYHLTGEWISKARDGSFETFDEFRTKFGRMEKDVFGDVSERVKNPVAMQYDRVRNDLVSYSGYKNQKDLLELAVKDFSEIQNPEH